MPEAAATAFVPIKDFAALVEERVKRIAVDKIGLNKPVNVIEHEAAAASIKRRM
jgi:hypothetical protein